MHTSVTRQKSTSNSWNKFVLLLFSINQVSYKFLSYFYQQVNCINIFLHIHRYYIKYISQIHHVGEVTHISAKSKNVTALISDSEHQTGDSKKNINEKIQKFLFL